MQTSARWHDRRDALKLPGTLALVPLSFGDGPDALLKTMHDDTERWGRIMRSTNFSAND